MTIQRPTLTAALAFALAASGLAASAHAAEAPAKKAAPVAKSGMKKALPVKRAEWAPPPATPEQADAAKEVYIGTYECEFKQAVEIVPSEKYPSYIDVKHGKADYLMKPVLSSTGAIRLEDTHGQTLMIQIANKSMLLNVKTGQRLVDDCVSPKQRELIEAAKAAKAAESAGGPVSAPPGMAVTNNGGATPTK